MIKRVLPVFLLISVILILSGCNNNNNTGNDNNDSGQKEEKVMNFTFESLQDADLMGGSSYFMDFGEMNSQEDAAIAEGKLLSAFGEPEFTSENYENSFNYIIRATAESGESVILTVYGIGVVHIGVEQKDDFAEKAAKALIEHVNSFKPADFERTVYYLDFDLQIDISVKDGVAMFVNSPISEEKINELFDKFFG